MACTGSRSHARKSAATFARYRIDVSLLDIANNIYVLIRYFGSVFERVYRVLLAETILLIAAAAGRVLFARVSKIKGVPRYVERIWLKFLQYLIVFAADEVGGRLCELAGLDWIME